MLQVAAWQGTAGICWPLAASLAMYHLLQVLLRLRQQPGTVLASIAWHVGGKGTLHCMERNTAP
jgi:hypothetical protein